MKNSAKNTDDAYFESRRFEVHAGRRRVLRNAPLKRAAVSMALLLALISSPAYAAQGERKKGAIGTAADAVTQPLNDLGLKDDEIPLTLLKIQQDPYSMEGLEQCTAIRSGIAELEEVLGPDADAPADSNGIVNKALKTGGSFLGGFIPFRGVVREISGANAARRKLERAVYAGVARRGFLKGYANAKQCDSAEDLAIDAARRRVEMLDKD